MKFRFSKIRRIFLKQQIYIEHLRPTGSAYGLFTWNLQNQYLPRNDCWSCKIDCKRKTQKRWQSQEFVDSLIETANTKVARIFKKSHILKEKKQFSINWYALKLHADFTLSRNRSSHRKCSIKKRVFYKNFTKFTGKHLCQSLVPRYGFR